MTDSPMLDDAAVRSEVERVISDNPVALFMKGTPDQPYCGFSARVVAALDGLGTTYTAVNVLNDPRIREQLTSLHDWPTIPQLFVDGTLVGGCDIVTEMAETGELAELIASSSGTR